MGYLGQNDRRDKGGVMSLRKLFGLMVALTLTTSLGFGVYMKDVARGGTGQDERAITCPSGLHRANAAPPLDL